MKTNPIAIVKDLVLFFGGLAGIAYQQLTNNVNIVLLVIFTAMTGVPGLTQIISLVRNSPIVLESRSSRPEPVESESGNVSSNSLGGDEP